MPWLTAASSKSIATVRVQKGDPESGHRYIQRRHDHRNTGLGDAWGNLAGFHLLPGQRHDICGVEPLLGDREFGALLVDKTFDADWLVKDLTERGSKVVILSRSNSKNVFILSAVNYRHE